MSRELAIIELIAQMTGQRQPLSDDAFWDVTTRQIYTTDMLVAGRHFDLAYFSPQDLGWKAAAVNISDLAAMGGTLRYLLISLGLPSTPELDLNWIRGLYEGFGEACQRFGGQIAGGDTVGSDQLVINVTAVGSCPVGHTPGHRYAAQPGDYIIATGFHGLSAVGLQTLRSGGAEQASYPASRAAHLRPMPRVEVGFLLSRRFERYALMDSSDGLADALLKIAQASGQRLVVNEASLPVHPEVQAYVQAQGGEHTLLRNTILYGGEDFELVGTVPEVDDALLQSVHVLGRVEAANGSPGAWLNTAESASASESLIPLSMAQTYQHFSASPEGSAHGA